MAYVGLCPLPDWKVPKWNPVWIPGTECLLQVLSLDHDSWKGLYVPWRLMNNVLLPTWKLITTPTQKFCNETKEEKRNLLVMLKIKMKLSFGVAYMAVI